MAEFPVRTVGDAATGDDRRAGFGVATYDGVCTGKGRKTYIVVLALRSLQDSKPVGEAIMVETGDHNDTCEHAITSCGIVLMGMICTGNCNSSTVHAYAGYDRAAGDNRATVNCALSVGEAYAGNRAATGGYVVAYQRMYTGDYATTQGGVSSGQDALLPTTACNDMTCPVGTNKTGSLCCGPMFECTVETYDVRCTSPQSGSNHTLGREEAEK